MSHTQSGEEALTPCSSVNWQPPPKGFGPEGVRLVPGAQLPGHRQAPSAHLAPAL